MDKKTIFDLLNKYLEGKPSQAEVKLLEEYYRRLEVGDKPGLSPDQEQALKEKMYRVIITRMKEPVVRKFFDWRRIAVAASFILTIGIGSYLFFFVTPRQTQGDNLTKSGIRPKDLPPGRDAAILKLDDGQEIILDSASGTIANKNGIQVINKKGLLSYEGKSSDDQVVYNTITTARGNQYQLQLEDGTRVWLNSASSLRFPVVFKGDKREVELTGEGYFEVAHNPAKPFKVVTDKQVVEVLGTHFNINSYSDEDAIRTTLLEGSVKTSIANGQSLIIKPGEQAVVKNSLLTINHSPDIEKVMAWKNGWFEFDQMDLGAIMRQVSRWYDVDIIYEGSLTGEKYGGRISKKLALSAVIEMMKANGVECKLTEKTLNVKP